MLSNTILNLIIPNKKSIGYNLMNDLQFFKYARFLVNWDIVEEYIYNKFNTLIDYERQ